MYFIWGLLRRLAYDLVAVRYDVVLPRPIRQPQTEFPEKGFPAVRPALIPDRRGPSRRARASGSDRTGRLGGGLWCLPAGAG